MNKDSLGDRMKSSYENRTRYYLPRRTNTIIRCDGRSFHTYTKDCVKPFDDNLMADMNNTAVKLCEEIQGARFAYVQSDEISVFVSDYTDIVTEAWFDGNLQKICSISASIATAEFNKIRMYDHFADVLKKPRDPIAEYKPANFDSRVFIIPEIAEVANYFQWRCQDASRNSLQMFARSLYSHTELEGKNSAQIHDLIHAKDKNWNDLAPQYKRGRLIRKHTSHGFTPARNHWTIDDIPDTHGFEYWKNLIHLTNDLAKDL